MRSMILLAAGSLAIGGSLAAQEPIESYSSVASYVVSIPTGDTRQLLTRPSWVGVAWQGLWGLDQSTAAGVLLSFNDFDHSSFGTSNFPWGAATGEQSRTLVATTVMATGRWYPVVNGARRLHVGLGAGMVYSSESYQLGLSQSVRGAAHLAVAPEAGWAFPIGNGIDGVVSARYSFSTTGGRYLGGARSYPFAALSFGVVER